MKIYDDVHKSPLGHDNDAKCVGLDEDSPVNEEKVAGPLTVRMAFNGLNLILTELRLAQGLVG